MNNSKISTLLRSALSLTMMVILISSCELERNMDDYSSSEFDLIQEELELPKEIADYQLKLGEHFLPRGKTFPELNSNSLADIQRNNNMATLGRVLFYDKNLSIDRNVSCGSCHHADHAFADIGQFSEGVNNNITKRNSLALATTLSFKISYNPLDNAQSRANFSWDDSATDLPQMIKNAFRLENEMNISEDEIVDRIREKPFYNVLFEKAYGNTDVNDDKIVDAITAFIDAISSTNSKFDEGLKRSNQFNHENNFYNFSDEENLGKSIYNSNCASCHSEKHNFTVKPSANNGLDMEYVDKGIGGRLNIEKLNGVFKIPFLRNIAVSGPYMHDGRFDSLEEVVEHYSTGIQNHPNLDPLLQNENGQAIKLNFSDEEKSALVAYLHTLTDDKILEDPKFSDPFK